MLCIVEIAMMVFGIVTLTKGSISFSRQRVVTGVPAYLIGALLTSTFPLVLGAGIVFGLIRAAQGQNAGDIPMGAFLIDIGVVATIGVTSAIIAAICGKDPLAIKQPQVASQTELPPPDPNNPYAR